MKKFAANFRGFYLLELLIVLTIIGIITSFSIPHYTGHIVHARRLEAAEWLAKLAIAMEHYHVEHNTYQGASLAALHLSEWIAKNNYQLMIQSATDNDYLIVAKPLGTQAENDAVCASLTVNSLGEKKITGTGNNQDCW